jgi:hypothetical protein
MTDMLDPSTCRRSSFRDWSRSAACPSRIGSHLFFVGSRKGSVKSGSRPLVSSNDLSASGGQEKMSSQSYFVPRKRVIGLCHEMRSGEHWTGKSR